MKGRALSNQRFQIDALDGLRGLAVLIVFIGHTSNSGIYLLPFANFSGMAKSGVFLFFVLSAFLLTLPFIQKGASATKKHFLINYFFRRFIRIYPLYFLYLLLGFISTLVLWRILGLDEPIGVPFELSLKEFFDHLLLIEGKGVTWTILVEVRYYLVIPILGLIYSVILKNKLLPSVLLTVSLITLGQLIWPQSEATLNDPRLGPYLPIFYMGSLLAVIFHHFQQNKLFENKKVVLVIEILAILAILALIFMIPSVSSYILKKEIPFNYYHKQFIVFGFLWSIVVFACISGRGILKILFEIHALRYLGFISFSTYLLHSIAIQSLRRVGADMPAQGWIMLAVTIAISHISWILIEKPTSKIRLFKQLQKA